MANANIEVRPVTPTIGAEIHGITPKVAIEYAKPSFCITHKPGHMLITDLLNAEMAAL